MLRRHHLLLPSASSFVVTAPTCPFLFLQVAKQSTSTSSKPSSSLSPRALKLEERHKERLRLSREDDYAGRGPQRTVFTPERLKKLEDTILLPETDLFTKENRILLAVDLDETLNHFHYIRPGAHDFIKEVSKHFELLIFTAAQPEHCEKMCGIFDPEGTLIHHRRCSRHCTYGIKDLSLLGRPIHRIAILDNNPKAYQFHRENAIPIKDWYGGDKEDRELEELLPMLVDRLAKADEVYDVVPGGHEYFGPDRWCGPL